MAALIELAATVAAVVGSANIKLTVGAIKSGGKEVEVVALQQLARLRRAIRLWRAKRRSRTASALRR
jgi:hypothetical protein